MINISVVTLFFSLSLVTVSGMSNTMIDKGKIPNSVKKKSLIYLSNSNALTVFHPDFEMDECIKNSIKNYTENILNFAVDERKLEKVIQIRSIAKTISPFTTIEILVSDWKNCGLETNAIATYDKIQNKYLIYFDSTKFRKLSFPIIEIVLSHEMGHVLLNHPKLGDTISIEIKERERHADTVGGYLLSLIPSTHLVGKKFYRRQLTFWLKRQYPNDMQKSKLYERPELRRIRVLEGFDKGIKAYNRTIRYYKFIEKERQRD